MNGNVGIGIANPAVQLQVFNGSTSYTTPTVSISDGAADNGGTYGMINLTRPGAVADGKAHLAFIRAGNTVFGMGYASSSNTFSLCPSFTSTAFSTGRGINIVPSGNVGIGTAAPRNALDVNGSVSLGNRLFGSTDASPTGNFWIGLNGTGTEAERLAISLAGNATTGAVSEITLNKPTTMTGDTSTSGKLTVQDVIRFGNYSGGSYDNIQFMRGTGSGQYPNIRCQENYIAMYVSDANGWVTGSKVGDMVFLVQAGKNIRMGVGGQSLLINNSNDVVASNNLTANCLVVNGGGTYQAGCIYSDASWGMLFRAKVAGTAAIFSWQDSAGTEKMRIHPNGNVGINAAVPGYTLHVGGNIYASGDITAFSDQRYKQNIIRLDRSLDAIRSLNGYSYTREDYRPGERHIGLLAQEVKEVLPEAVSYDSINDKYSVNYNCLMAPVVEAIKELYDRIDAQAKIIEKQQTMIQQLLDHLALDKKD